MEIVHDIPEGAPIINIEGEKGKSLFNRPLIWGLEEDLKLLRAQYTEYERLISEAEEERLLALVGAMSMAEALDFFLRAYIPGYRKLEKLERDFTLFMKIELARSLKIIPAHIFDAADLVRDIRNKFAHDLRISCFDDLDEPTKDKLKQKHSAFYPKNTNNDITLADVFHKVVDGVIISFEIYASNLRIARDYIHSGDFIKELTERIKGKSR